MAGLSFRVIEQEVVKRGACYRCLACVYACPLRSLKVEHGKPVLKGRCSACGLCVTVCPSYANRDVSSWSGPGEYVLAVKARSLLRSVVERCEDGGAVTSLVLAGFREGFKPVVALGDSREPLKPIYVVAESEEKIVEATGSKYVFSTPIPILAEMREKALLVGLPCTTLAARALLKARRIEAVLISLFCYTSFEESFVKLVRQLVAPLKPTKVSIKRGKLLIKADGREILKPLKAVAETFRKPCYFCPDYTGLASDISAGSALEKGWTLLLIRSEKGLRLVRVAERLGLLELTRASRDELEAVARTCERKLARAAKFRK